VTTEQKILSSLPYCEPFLFVDRITNINENSIAGSYTFNPESFFYKGHFKDKPVTPGVILLECMGQIGLVCFGIYLLNLHEKKTDFSIVLSNLESDFFKIVYPEETVFVHSEKMYLRNNILKCRIRLSDNNNETITTTIASCKFKLES